jgi:hypothetical protein
MYSGREKFNEIMTYDLIEYYAATKTISMKTEAILKSD